MFAFYNVSHSRGILSNALVFREGINTPVISLLPSFQYTDNERMVTYHSSLDVGPTAGVTTHNMINFFSRRRMESAVPSLEVPCEFL